MTELTFSLCVLTAAACIGGFLFGYDTGIVSGAMVYIVSEYKLSDFWHELIVSSTIGAAAVFAVFGGISSDLIGRRPTIIIASILFVAGSVFLSAAQGKWTLLVGRLIVGAGIGTSSMCNPIYLSEMAPVSMRGLLVALNNYFVILGQLFANVIAGFLSYYETNGWRWMFGLAAIPATIQLVLMFLVPESPRYLVVRSKYEKAKKALTEIRPSKYDVDGELNGIKSSVYSQSMGACSTLLRMFSSANVRMAMFVGCMLQAFQQLLGINTVMYYSASLIKMAGLTNNHDAIWASAVINAIYSLFSLSGPATIDRLGRKILLLISTAGVTLSLLYISATFYYIDHNAEHLNVTEGIILSNSCDYTTCSTCVSDNTCGFCYNSISNLSRLHSSCLPVNKYDSSRSTMGICKNSSSYEFAVQNCPNSFSFFILVGICLYLIFFGPGLGPIPWTVNSEIYQQWARGAGNALSTTVNWSFNFLVSMTFLTLVKYLTEAGTFLLYAVFGVIFFVIVLMFLPETKGISLESVDTLFVRKIQLCKKQDAEDSTVLLH